MTAPRRLPPLRIELRPSFLLAGVLGGGHLLAMVAAAVALRDLELVLPACATLAVHGWLAVRRHALLRHPRSIVALELSSEVDCTARRRDHATFRCRVSSSSYLTHVLIVLTLVRDGGLLPARIVVMPDSSSADGLRRLRVRLRWSKLD